MEVYALEMKWYSMMKKRVFEEPYVDTVCTEWVASYLYFVFGTHKNIQWKKRRRLMLIPCMVITHLQLPRKNLSHTSSYFYNEQQVLCQGWIIRNMIEPLGKFVWLGYNIYWHAQIKYHWSDVYWSMKKLWWWLQYGSSIWQAFGWTPTWHRYM